MSASLLNQQSLKPLPILLASLLASIFLLSSVSLDVSGGYTRPSSIWFPNPLSPAPFDLPLNRLTGLVGNGTTFNIAVMVLCASYSPGITPPAVNTTLLQSTDPMDQMTAFAQIRAMQLSPEQVESGACQTGIGLYSDFYRGMLLFQDRVNRQCNGNISDPSSAAVGKCGIPTSTFDPATGEQLRARLNLVYFNLGPLPIPGTPDEAYTVQTFTHVSLLANLISAGAYSSIGRFPVVFPPPYGGEQIAATFAERCDTTKQCIVITAYGSSNNYLTCIQQPLAPYYQTMGCPPECIAKGGGCRGQRRFDYSFTFLYDQTNVLTNLITHLKMKGARTAAAFFNGNPNAELALSAVASDLSERGIKLIYQKSFHPTEGRVPMTDAEIAQIAARLMALDPDIVALVSDTQQQQDVIDFARLVVAFKQLNWMPRAIVGGAGSYTLLATTIASLTGNPTDAGLIYGSNVNEYRLRTRAFKTIPSPPEMNAVLTVDNPNMSWEPFPADPVTNEYGSYVYYKEYVAAFGDSVPQSMLAGYILPIVSGTMLAMACKLFERAGTDDVSLLQAASYRVSSPSIGGLIQFDTLGRLVSMDQPVVQIGADGISYHLITPLDVGEPDNYPLPTWEERVFSKSTLSSSSEKVVIAINTIVIGFVVALILGIVWYRTHAVIKASSAPFCILTLLGAVICLCSNYCTSLHATAEACAANVWLLTTGFTIMFGSLWAKTWRIYRIFESGKLSVVKISSSKLFAIVCLALAVDVIINVIWSAAAPFKTEIIVVDALRPAYNYQQCAYNSTATGLIYAQLAWKAALILAALVLTVLARNLPSSFNESTYLGASIYNVGVLFIFLVPIVATGVGGRDTTYLIRNYGVMVLVATTMMILFVPKFFLIHTMKGPSTLTQLNKTQQSSVAEHGSTDQAGVKSPKSPVRGSNRLSSSHHSDETVATKKEAVIRIQESRYAPHSPPQSPSTEGGDTIMSLQAEINRLRSELEVAQQMARTQQENAVTAVTKGFLPGETIQE